MVAPLDDVAVRASAYQNRGALQASGCGEFVVSLGETTIYHARFRNG
jgi:hypothetical protein